MQIHAWGRLAWLLIGEIEKAKKVKFLIGTGSSPRLPVKGCLGIILNVRAKGKLTQTQRCAIWWKFTWIIERITKLGDFVLWTDAVELTAA